MTGQFAESEPGAHVKSTLPDSLLDRIVMRDLMVRGTVGINPEERRERQDVLVSVTMWANTRPAATSDDITDAVNYRTVAKALINHIESSQPFLVERLAADLVKICFDTDPRVQAVELTVEKPGALRFARSVGVVIYRRRQDMVG